MTNEMRALVKSRPEPGLWMEHVPVPGVGPTDVLIRVRKSAICGTDVHIWKWDEFSAKTVPVPMVVGHEFIGEILDMGAAACKYRIVSYRAAGQRRGSYRLPGLPELPCGARASVPQHARRRREPTRQLCRIPVPSRNECGADP